MQTVGQSCEIQWASTALTKVPECVRDGRLRKWTDIFSSRIWEAAAYNDMCIICRVSPHEIDEDAEAAQKFIMKSQNTGPCDATTRALVYHHDRYAQPCPCHVCPVMLHGVFLCIVEDCACPSVTPRIVLHDLIISNRMLYEGCDFSFSLLYRCDAARPLLL